MYTINIKGDKIGDKIGQIDVHKSSATPRLSIRLLKYAFDVLIDELCYMLNIPLYMGNSLSPGAFKIITDLFEAISIKEPFLLVYYIDHLKAFDTIDHNIL